MNDDELELDVDEQIREIEKKQAGEWAICASLVFVSALLVLLLCHQARDENSALAIGSTLTTIFTFQVNADFPVDIAVIMLLISIMSFILIKIDLDFLYILQSTSLISIR